MLGHRYRAANQPRLVWMLGCVLTGLLGLVGCVNPQTRFQSAEENEREKDLDVRTVGEITEVGNAGPLAVSGVGLVTGLNGTGGSPAGLPRTMLENQFRKQKIEHVKQLLESPDNALVLVSGAIPAGSRKGEAFDIEITLPHGSKATSLAGGFLQPCVLRNYDTTKKLNPDYQGANRLLEGHILGHAGGPLLVGFGSKDDGGEQRRARVWGGAVSHIDRPFFLILNNDQKFARVANAVAQRINLMFPDDRQKREQLLSQKRLLVLDEVTEKLNRQFSTPAPGRSTMAKALNKEVIDCNVPYAYRLNRERYLRVARLIPLQQEPDQMGRYRQRLEKMLVDPGETVRAALRLEALGKDSIGALKKGLESGQPLVQFCAAEALAYLGSTAGCEHLARLAEQHDALRHWSLLALAGLEESVCRQHLAGMLGCPDAEVRCGAFRALRLMDESDKNLHGEQVQNAFWLHTVAPGSPPLVFYSIRQRAEVALFGSGIHLLPPVKILAGPEFTITAEPGDDRCTLSRFVSRQGNVVRRQCSLQLEEVLRTLADMGGQFPDVVDFLTKAGERRGLSCPVSCQTLPQEVSVETLAEGGKDPDFLKNP